MEGRAGLLQRKDVKENTVMNTLHASSIPGFNSKALWGKDVKDRHAETMVSKDTVVYIDGLPQILYINLDFDLSDLLWAVKQIKYQKSTRTAGMVSTSATFGYMPRRALLQDFCHSSNLQTKSPQAAYILEETAGKLAEIYQQHFPSVYAAHKEVAEVNILPEWRMGEGNSIFSSGIVNKDNQLPYHKDAGNFPGVYSNMVGLKHGIQGGHLICPEFGLKFEISDGSLLIFNGQEILHGVSPIKKMSADAYRYTVVYYTMQQMWKCLPMPEEIKRIRRVKTSREQKRAGVPILTKQ